MSTLDPTAIHALRGPDSIPGFRLQALIGKGGMGEVHRATQLSLQRTVAVKVLNTELAGDPTFVDRFEKEAAALATLSHPNIVDIVDRGHHGDDWYLVMQFIEGPSLREVMQQPVAPTAAVGMILDVCRGIAHAHARGVIHRDLKPENILLDQRAGGVVKVTDFGLASFLSGPNEGRFQLTATHVAMGTLSYMAPEQRVDAASADYRADIFSIGVMLYELLTGEVPVGNYDPPSARRPGVDPKLDAVVARCLRPAPDERYATVEELIAELEPFAPVRNASTPPPSGPGPVRQAFLRVTRAVTRTAAVALVLAAAGVLLVSWLRSRQPPPTPFAGAAVTGELAAGPMPQARGRVERGPLKRSLLLGDGPDAVPLLTFGRAAAWEDEAIVFPHARGNPFGRVLPDVVELDGDDVRVRTRVSTGLKDAGAEALFRRVVFAEAPEARATVLLLGSPGRYAAVTLSHGGAPVQFEWALGERRGVMLGPESPRGGPVALELSVDRNGALRALLGEGADQRPIAEPVQLGPEWQKHFGAELRAAAGCVEGTCRFEAFSVLATVAPPPPPPPEPEPTPVTTPAPAPKVVTRPAPPAAPKPVGKQATSGQTTAPAAATKKAPTRSATTTSRTTQTKQTTTTSRKSAPAPTRTTDRKR